MKKRTKLQFDVIMILVSIYMTIDYYRLIISGDDLIRRKIVLVVWAIAIIGWTVKLIYDIRKKQEVLQEEY